MRRFTALLLASILLASCTSAPENASERRVDDASVTETPPEALPPTLPPTDALDEVTPPADVAAVAAEPEIPEDAASLVETVAAAETPRPVDERVPPGWQFGVQAYTFRSFTFFQTVERAAALGLMYVEMYPGQRIGGEVAGSTGHGMDAAARASTKEKLASSGVALSAYGVVNAIGEKGWRQVFEFAKDMGIGTIVIEPPANQLGIVSALCDEYRINAAIHNHAKPTGYWDPAIVKAALEGTSARLGACPDVGHWTRSGLDTRTALDVLAGRVLAIHLKDVKDGQYVPLGEGDARIAGVMARLKRQGFAGPVSIEHEGDARNPFMPVRHGSRFVTENALKSVEDLEAGNVATGRFADDVSEVWGALDPGDDGLWAQVKDDDTSAYADLTDFAEGTVSAPDEGFPKEHYTCAFDNTSQTKYCVKLPAVWIQYAFPAGVKHAAVAYSIRTANDAPERDPRDWKVLGSNDGENYEVLDERSDESFEMRFHKRLFEIAAPGAYTIYKLDITRTKGDADTTQLSEIELLIKKEDAPAGMLPPEVKVPLSSHPDSAEWPALFDADLKSSIAPDGVWTFDEGVLTASKDEAIWSAKSYDNFIVDLEFKTAEGTNSGVIVYCSDIGAWIPNSIEIQIADDHSDKWSGGHPNTKCGAFYGHQGASKSVVKKPGEWNRCTVTCKDHMIYVMLNGEAVNEMDMRAFTSATKNPDGSDVPSWLNKPVASLPTSGHIGLQGKHAGAPIYFRRLRIQAIR